MGFGYALGGIAKGFQTQEALNQRNTELGLRQQALTASQSRLSQGLQIRQQKMEQDQTKALTDAADKNIAQTMKIVTETVKQSIANGATPDKALAAVQPLLDHVDQMSKGIGKDPGVYHDTVSALAGVPPKQPNISAMETVNRKIQSGQPLTPGDQALIDSQQHLSVRDKLLVDAINGDKEGSAAPPVSGATKMEVSPSGQARPIPTPYQLQILKQNANNKDAKAAFDETFGAGAADHFLQGGS